MEWVIVLAIVGLGVWFWIKNMHQKMAEQAKKQEEQREQARAKAAAAQLLCVETEESFVAEWPVREGSSGTLSREYLMISIDQKYLRVADVSYHPKVEFKRDHIIAVRDLVSVELQQSSETIMRLETMTTTKKNSPLLRAAVGGIAFGGAGAIVGAVSAKETSTGTTTSKSVTKKGPIYLVIGTTDIKTPLVKYKIPDLNMDKAEQWLHRIRGAIAVCERQ